jgi:hypothetical protein
VATTPQGPSAWGKPNYHALTTRADWLRRKRERLLLLTATTLDRELEIEFVLPAVFRENRDANPQYAPVVLEWIPKGHASTIEIVDRAGSRLPSLNASEANALQIEMILALAQNILGTLPSDALRNEVSDAIHSGSLDTIGRTAVWSEILGEPGDLPRSGEAITAIREALRWAIHSDAIVLELDASNQDRQLVRLSYQMHLNEADATLRIGRLERIRRTLGWSETRYLLPINEHESAAYELRVEAPEGVELVRTSLLRERPNPGIENVQSVPTLPDGRVARLTVPAQLGRLVVEFVVRPRRYYPAAVFLAAALSAIVLGADYLRLSTLARSTEAPSAILLAVPALLTTLVAQPGSGSAGATLLRGARVVLALCGLLTYAAAVVLVLYPSDHLASTGFLHRFWFIDMALCALLAVLLITPILGAVLDRVLAFAHRFRT